MTECSTETYGGLVVTVKVFEGQDFVDNYEFIESKIGENELLEVIFDIKLGKTVSFFLLEGVYLGELVMNTFFVADNVPENEVLESMLGFKVLNDYKELKDCVLSKLGVN